MTMIFQTGRAAASGILLAASISVTALLVGCSGRPSLLPNIDPALRKTSTEFAVDAAHRFPYKADAPKAGDAIGRAEIAYMYKRIEIENLSADAWNNVELWINEKYVVFIPKMVPHVLEELPFTMFYNDQGDYFPKENSSPSDSLVKKLELYMDGKMYNVPIQMPDH